MIRQKTIYCGRGKKPRFKEVDIYYFSQRPRNRRARRSKKSSEVQERLNDKNSRRYLNQLIKANFFQGDYRVDLTYSDENMPASEEEADKLVYNFIKRVKRMRNRLHLEPLKYIWINELGMSGRIHHHLIMSGGIDRETMESLWSFRKRKGEKEPRSIGYIRVEPLRFSRSGIDGLVVYITKETFKQEKDAEGQLSFGDIYEGKELSLSDLLVSQPQGKKRWKQSKNLIKPRERTRNYAYSKKQIQKLVSMPSDCEDVRNFFSRRFEGYEIDTCRYQFNEVTATWAIYLTMHRRD